MGTTEIDSGASEIYLSGEAFDEYIEATNPETKEYDDESYLILTSEQFQSLGSLYISMNVVSSILLLSLMPYYHLINFLTLCHWHILERRPERSYYV